MEAVVPPPQVQLFVEDGVHACTAGRGEDQHGLGQDEFVREEGNRGTDRVRRVALPVVYVGVVCEVTDIHEEVADRYVNNQALSDDPVPEVQSCSSVLGSVPTSGFHSHVELGTGHRESILRSIRETIFGGGWRRRRISRYGLVPGRRSALRCSS